LLLVEELEALRQVVVETAEVELEDSERLLQK
jgi:hypothetical protein